MRVSFRVQNRLDDVLESGRVSDCAIGQLDARSGAEANHQLDAFEAAEAEVAFEMSLRAARGERFKAAIGAQFEQELIDDFEGLRLRDGGAIEFCAGGTHGKLRR